MRTINIEAIVKSVVENQTGYEDAIKHLCNIAPTTPQFTAEDLAIAGSTLSWLARYGVLKIVGQTEKFVCIDEYEETYKKMTVNIYAIDCDIFALANAFADAKKTYKVGKVEKRIASLKSALADALADLEAIERE